MDPFEIACPHCTGRLRVTLRKLIGRKVNCPRCGVKFLVTEPETNNQAQEMAVGSGSSIHGAFSGSAGSDVLQDSPSVPPHFQTGLSDLSSDDVVDYDEPYDDSPGESFDHKYAQADSNQSHSDYEYEEEPSSSYEGQYDFENSGEVDYAEESKPSYSRKPKKQQDYFTLLLAGGIPAAIGLIIALCMLYSKGYLTGGSNSQRDWRQDGSRFRDFASDVKASDWNSSPSEWDRRSNRNRNRNRRRTFDLTGGIEMPVGLEALLQQAQKQEDAPASFANPDPFE